MQHKPSLFSLNFTNKLINITLHIFSTLHSHLYRYTNGRFVSRIYGNRVLLLTTIGRKTGKERITPLAYLTVGDELIIIGGAAGLAKYPDWWLNLQAYPIAEVQLGGRRLRVRAIEATPEQQLALWKEFPGMHRRFAFMQKRMQRRIPVVILSPESISLERISSIL
jgi:deazaflavin-dependent oxidoreductase (nitroreductase family)